MHIESAEVSIACPGRNYTTLIVRTSDGAVGLGDATLNGRELAVASYLNEHVIPLLLGRDPHQIEDTWQYLYRGAYWRRGPVTMAAIAAVDVALWDIKAKVAGLPLYQLLGGASRTYALAYGHATGREEAELVESIYARLDEGFTAVRIQCGIPGIERAYGTVPTAAPKDSYEPARGYDRPDEEDWDTEVYLRHMPKIFETVRARFPELPLLHDVHSRLTPTEAARLCRRLEPFDPYWIEDPTPIENQAALRNVRRHTTVPLATGEILNTIWDYQTLITDQLIDFVRSSVTHAGGITPLRRILDLAGMYQIRSGIHGPSDISPVGLAAALHLDIAIHNFGIQEYMPHPEESEKVFQASYSFREGAFWLSSEPGLGVHYDEEASARFPYRRAYLPVVRLRDGSIHDW